MKIVKAAALVVLLIPFSAGGSNATSVAFQINIAHSGYVHFSKGFAPPFQRRWVRDLGGPVSYPLIANSKVFVTVGNSNGSGSQLYALNAKTGKTVWHKIIGGLYGWSGAAYDNGMIFVLNSDGLLQAFASDRTGKPAWAVQLRDESSFTAAPTAFNGQVFTAGYGFGGILYGVNESTGFAKWEKQVEGGAASSPALGGGGLFVSYPCWYYRFEPSDGHLDWYDNTGCSGGGGATPVYYNGHVFVRDDQGIILDADTGATVGSFASSSPPVLFADSGVDYMITLLNGKLSSIALSTGKVAWTFAGDGYLVSDPIVVNGLAIVGSSSGELYFVDRLTGDIVWSDDVGTPFTPTLEFDLSHPWPGFGASAGMLVTPAGSQLVAYVQQ